jgi:hypothetical protein
MRCRWSTGLLIVALLAPGLESLAESAAHGCTTHVCHCRAPHQGAALPPEAPKAKPCHEAGAAQQTVPMRDCTIRGACRHEAPPLASATPYTLEAPLIPSRLIDTGRARPDAHPTPLVGFDRIDPRPPRTAA